jgi:hypothetical protein
VDSVSGDSDEELIRALALSEAEAKPATGLFCICHHLRTTPE